MAQYIKIDPVNRIEGHQKWKLRYVADGSGYSCNKAWVEGIMFRGFEQILRGRDPRDAIIMCGRI